MPHFWLPYRDGERPPSGDTGVRILSHCGIHPRPAGRIVWQGKSFRSLPIPVKYMRFAMTARFFSGETWHHVSPIPQGDPPDATNPKQKPGFVVHVGCDFIVGCRCLRQSEGVNDPIRQCLAGLGVSILGEALNRARKDVVERPAGFRHPSDGNKACLGSSRKLAPRPGRTPRRHRRTLAGEPPGFYITSSPSGESGHGAYIS
jgi:hypothetical protein